MRKRTRKSLRRGKDWHAWAFYEPGKDGVGLCHWAQYNKPTTKPSPDGKWVRVRFVKVRTP